MHNLEPFQNWENLYDPGTDEKSPFFGTRYEGYELSLYDHYIHPLWDYIGSETLYVKVLYIQYEEGYAIIEMMGEWNDTLHNDIMNLKRNLIDPLIFEGIRRFVLIGENILNFHGLEDDYYQEWYEEAEEGWIVAMGFREFVYREWTRYGLDACISWGGRLEITQWRTLSPAKLMEMIQYEMGHRLP
jgi:hypothetical protein